MTRYITHDLAGGDGGTGELQKSGRIHGARVVLWVASECGVNAAALAKCLEAAHGGAASVTLVSVEEVSANDWWDGSPIDDLNASAPAIRHRRQCNAAALGDGAVAAQADPLLDDAKDALTPREVQVVEHLRQGFTNKEIARTLGIMEDTVKKHLQSVFAKLGVRCRTLVALRTRGSMFDRA